MSPRVPKGESMGIRDLKIADILTSSGKFPERPVKWPPAQNIVAHAYDMVAKLNRLLLYWERPITISSGYRPPAVNAVTKGAAKGSLHQMCAAVDVVDPGGRLAAFCLADLPMLEHLGLWMEDPAFTRGWCHLQLFAPKSGNRVFQP